MAETITSTAEGKGCRVAVVLSRWYPEIIEGLKAGAMTTLSEAGVAEADILQVEVPGAYELPQAAAWIARTKDVDAIVALGVVIRGETPHFDFVSASCCDGLMRVACDTGIPVGLGVITADTAAQAQARAGEATGKRGNNGIEAADAAVRMAATYKALEARRRQT